MKSLLWSIAVLFSSLAATMLALANYCYDSYLCSEQTVRVMNVTSIIFFSLSSFMLFGIIAFSIRNNTLKQKNRKEIFFCI